VPAIGAHDVGAYRVVHVADLDGPTPWPGQFDMLASEERWGGGDDELPHLPRALSFLGGRARTRMTAVEFGLMPERRNRPRHRCGPGSLAALVRAMWHRVTTVKLSPNTAAVAAVAQAAEAEGADAVSLIGTLPRHSLYTGFQDKTVGSAAAPADRRAGGPRRRACADCRGGPPGTHPDRRNGRGGTGTQTKDLLDGGAHIVAVGTESLPDPAAGAHIARELKSLQIAGSRSAK
jgi:hypothetical protein